MSPKQGRCMVWLKEPFDGFHLVATPFDSLKNLESLVLLGFFMLSVPAVCSAEQLGPYTYTLTGGKATITSFNENYSGSLSMTNELSGYPVTSIGYLVFRKCKGLTNIRIPDSVTSIRLGAFFNCHSLKNVTIGAGVTSIEDTAFSYCFALTNIEVSTRSENYSSLGGVLFNRSQTILKTFPAGKAGAYVIPDHVVSIGDNAFLGCIGLSSIWMPDRLSSIGGDAFGLCKGLADVRIPDAVMSIGHGAFSGCEGLTNVMIGAGVTNIGANAFTHCDSLRSMYFIGSAPTCQETSFNSCTNLTLYYSSSATNGWSNAYAGRPTKIWSPSAQ